MVKTNSTSVVSLYFTDILETEMSLFFEINPEIG